MDTITYALCKREINKRIAELGDVGLQYKIVDELPLIGEKQYIYLVKDSDATSGDSYKEYLFVNGSFEMIGNTGTFVKEIGDLSRLKTENKTSLVDAVNEVDDKVVIVTIDNNTASMTPTEINDAYLAGKIVKLFYGNSIYLDYIPNSYAFNKTARFIYYDWMPMPGNKIWDQSIYITVTVNSDKTITSNQEYGTLTTTINTQLKNGKYYLESKYLNDTYYIFSLIANTQNQVRGNFIKIYHKNKTYHYQQKLRNSGFDLLFVAQGNMNDEKYTYGDSLIVDAAPQSSDYGLVTEYNLNKQPFIIYGAIVDEKDPVYTNSYKATKIELSTPFGPYRPYDLYAYLNSNSTLVNSQPIELWLYKKDSLSFEGNNDGTSTLINYSPAFKNFIKCSLTNVWSAASLLPMGAQNGPFSMVFSGFRKLPGNEGLKQVSCTFALDLTNYKTGEAQTILTINNTEGSWNTKDNCFFRMDEEVLGCHFTCQLTKSSTQSTDYGTQYEVSDLDLDYNRYLLALKNQEDMTCIATLIQGMGVDMHRSELIFKLKAWHSGSTYGRQPFLEAIGTARSSGYTEKYYMSMYEDSSSKKVIVTVWGVYDFDFDFQYSDTKLNAIPYVATKNSYHTEFKWTVPASDLSTAADTDLVTAKAVKDSLPTIPESLKNPHVLTIKIGSQTYTYDGSSDVTIEIPRT